ncbi:MAG: hypothetical protein J7K00_03870 [Candidatus Diapherotrites archaeon]|nr:hypothetical protein [Candidatus Diapherotrites archaeon]
MIKKTVFTSIPNSDTGFIIDQLKKRIVSNGGRINEDRLTFYPRTSGVVQVMGRDFWRTLRQFEPVEYVEELGSKTDLILFKPNQDEVLADKYYEEYEHLKNAKYVKIDGDHNFKKKEDRKNLFKQIKEFLVN